MKKLIILTLTLILFLYQVSIAGWEPDAGLISPYTKNATITVSSGNNFLAIIDGDQNSYWESTSPLPENYISSRDLNIFLNTRNYSLDKNNKLATLAFDGITSSKAIIKSNKFKVSLNKPELLSLISIKINTIDTVWITLNSVNEKTNYYYSPTENYTLKAFNLDSNIEITSINFKCKNSFEVFEVAGLSTLPFEYVIFDLHKEQSIGWIGSRHYNGEGVVSISVLSSMNKVDWKEISTLNPNTTTFTQQLVSPEVKARYIKVSFLLQPKAYQKAKLQEFEVYDSNGPFGSRDNPRLAKNTYGESMGINAIWGWGYNTSSDKLSIDSGPNMFNSIAGLARNYHGLDWDIKNPKDNPRYEKMAFDKGTSATPWVNWDTEYGAWKKAGMEVDACIMFNNQYFPDTLWHFPKDESYNYGASFGKHFSKKKSLVSLVEIGNEPWEYSKTKYRDILLGMSKGLKSNSDKLKVLPCATQAYHRKADIGNYISEYITKKNSAYIQGLNTHVYSYVFDYNGNRFAVNPEDPRSEVWSINNLKKFSYSNLSGIPVYVTEFGYDSHGGGDDCTHTVCVSETTQAIYGTRMALILYRLGVEQFYWYYYANVDYTSMLHNRSGLTSSHSKGFQKKKSFFSFQLLKENLGNYYFHDIIMENDDAYVYAYSDESGKIKRIIAWRPTSNNHDQNEWIEFPCSSVIEEVIPITNTTESNTNTSYVRSVNSVRISLSGIPVIIKLK